jgi:N12 class adenine-specific DNA methylase
MSVQDELLIRVRGEYREMPGLSLTAAQAARLWQVDHATSERILDLLTRERFLTKTPAGRFVAVPVARPIKASLGRRQIAAAS